MFIEKKPKIDRHIDKDVVLCRTTNRRTSRHTTSLLSQNSIPFTIRWKHVPLFRREAYKGASEVCIIQTNRNTYVKARRVIDLLERHDRDRLFLNAI